MFGNANAAVYTTGFDLALTNPAAAEAVAQMNHLPMIALTMVGGASVFAVILLISRFTRG